MPVASKGSAVVLVCLLAGASISGHQAATGSQPAPTKGSCRTYDTSTTAVTVAGSVRVTVASSGVFDPWSNRTTQHVTYSDSRGIRYDYTQATTYASMEDFIAEVVRLKPPAPASSNPPGIQVNIVPPLMRFPSTTASGKIAFTMTNSFDGQGRLAGSVNTTPSGAVTTRYTAWDSTG